jgi:hypothetical protein
LTGENSQLIVDGFDRDLMKTCSVRRASLFEVEGAGRSAELRPECSQLMILDNFGEVSMVFDDTWMVLIETAVALMGV